MTGARWWGVVRLVVGLGLLGWVLAVTHGWQVFLRLGAHPTLLLAFMAQITFATGVEAARLTLLVRSQGVRLSYRRMLRLVLISLPFGFVIPGGVGGDVIKIHGLGRTHPGRRVELGAAVLVDRLCGLISLLGVAVTAALLSRSFASAPAPLRALVWLAGLGVLMVAGGLLAVWSPAIGGRLALAVRTVRGRTGSLLRRLLAAIAAFRDHRPAMIGAIAVSVCAHLTLIATFVFVARSLVPNAPTGLVAWVSPLALVGNLLPFTPGGIGVGEAAFAGAFRLAGFAGGAQLLLAWRASVMPLAAVGGLLYIVGERGTGLAAASHPEAVDGG